MNQTPQYEENMTEKQESVSTPHPTLSGSPILVPLDGSVRAESALPFARHLAASLHTPLLLARVIDPLPASFSAPYYSSMPPDAFYPPTSIPPETYQTIMNQGRQQADTYLHAQVQ